jgi:UDP-GlcNAc:undecaprenyl-phosphate GlcNAc-1-phosphate transferase
VHLLVPTLVACGLTVLLIVLLRRPAERLHLIDHPGGRKRHSHPVPLTGGLALTLGFYAALVMSFPALGKVGLLLALIAVLAFIGLVDDFFEASPRIKLAVQLLAAVLMTTFGEHSLVSLGNLFGRGSLLLGVWSIPLTLFATVAVVNGINMLDGLDGLAGGLVAVMLGYFAAFAFWLGDAESLTLIVALLGAVIGFLLLNAPHPWRGRWRTFMGDAGSLVLGFAVAWFTIDLTQRRPDAVPPVVMLWVVGLVLFDLFTVTVRRLLRRRSPVAADRAHIHHLLQRCGLSSRTAWATLVAVNVLLGAIGTLGWRTGVAEPVLFGAYLTAGVAYVAAFIRPRWLIRRLRKPSTRPSAGQRFPQSPPHRGNSPLRTAPPTVPASPPTAARRRRA